MATKTVKDEKTADVPAGKNSARVKTSSVSRYTVDELSKAENESEKVVDHVLLKEAMKHLEQKEQQMIYYRYFEGKTQQEIAKIFHISQVQVSRIQKKILKKLRRQMIGNI